MNIVLCSREEEQRTLAHGIILCTEDEADYLIHYGIKGQKRGERRWQNEDGSLTPEGYIHYGIGQGNKHFQKAEKLQKKVDNAQMKYNKALLRPTTITGRLFGNKKSRTQTSKKLRPNLKLLKTVSRLKI